MLFRSVAIRDAEVAAEASGIAKPRLLMLIFLLAGGLGGIAGGLFASLQSYITPDAFTFEMSVLFFIAILIGGRGSILGRVLGTIILTALPEFAAPLVQWSTFLYAALLLLIVLVIPGGIADLLDFKNRRPLTQHREIVPRPELLARALDKSPPTAISLKDISLHFGGVRAIDGLDPFRREPVRPFPTATTSHHGTLCRKPVMQRAAANTAGRDLLGTRRCQLVVVRVHLHHATVHEVARGVMEREAAHHAAPVPDPPKSRRW